MTKHKASQLQARQTRIVKRIQTLFWLSQRYGDNAKYQGFDQEEVLGELMQEAILLRLEIFAKVDSLIEEHDNKKPPERW